MPSIWLMELKENEKVHHEDEANTTFTPLTTPAYGLLSTNFSSTTVTYDASARPFLNSTLLSILSQSLTTINNTTVNNHFNSSSETLAMMLAGNFSSTVMNNISSNLFTKIDISTITGNISTTVPTMLTNMDFTALGSNLTYAAAAVFFNEELHDAHECDKTTDIKPFLLMAGVPLVR